MIWAKNFLTKIGIALGLTVRCLTLPCRAKSLWVRRPALVIYSIPLFVLYVALGAVIGILDAAEDYCREIAEVWS